MFKKIMQIIHQNNYLSWIFSIIQGNCFIVNWFGYRGQAAVRRGYGAPLKLFLTVFLFLVIVNAHAKPTDAEIYLNITRNLRCVVCQNQSLAESEAPLAYDMKKLIAKKIRQGESPSEIYAYMQQRYGDYILYNPPVNGYTVLLWFSPFILLLIGGLFFFRFMRFN